MSRLTSRINSFVIASVRGSQDRRFRFELKRELAFERLESRLSPASELQWDPTTSVEWFKRFDEVPRLALEKVEHSPASVEDQSFIGPRTSNVEEWIVQLKQESYATIENLNEIAGLLSSGDALFQVISGLGTPGLVHVRSEAEGPSAARASLVANASVSHFSPNRVVKGTAIPSDSEFGRMTNLHNLAQFGGLQDADVDAPEAWDITQGSTSIVVGVIDSGIDVTHPDLYRNVWLNQGEIPSRKRSALTDTDADGLITFYDLNSSANASATRDFNRNGYIDAIDLLEDPLWAEGVDDDKNGFIDDFFGWNFRTGAGETPNNPSDALGHGTHVAGTIGAMGNNAIGTTGINWRTSLMSLRFLDNNNQGDTASAIMAVNYATMMRTRYKTDVRVLNNSWGQPGNPDVSLQAAIQSAGEADILFVAAAGNGNILGTGIDNDRTPFYPANYDLPNVISVAAVDANDRLAVFSNFGATTVDIAAPGVGVLSTVPRGRYASVNGTSMATPHVSGAAALVWSAFPAASSAEIKKAILSTADPFTNGAQYVSSAGRLNIADALNADVFAPSAKLIAKQDVTEAGGTATELTVEFSHRGGVDLATIGDDDLIIRRTWGARDTISATLKANSIVTTSTSITATYIVAAPGGFWDALDFGDYVASTVAGKVLSKQASTPIEERVVGQFNVRVIDPSVLYVNTFADSLNAGSLRSAIIAANAVAPVPRTIILESGRYSIDIFPVVDAASPFGPALTAIGIRDPGGWNNASTGDFDIQNHIVIVGSSNDSTIIDAKGLDRAFKVHAGASLELSRMTIERGISPTTQSGGAILSIGALKVENVILRKNRAIGSPIFGGAIAALGTTDINESWITNNEADYGGGVFFAGPATGTITRSTFDSNQGGGLYSFASGNVRVENSTFSANTGGYGAIANGIADDFIGQIIYTDFSLSGDGRFVAFTSIEADLVPYDTFGTTDVFVFDRMTNTIERVSVNNQGEGGNSDSFSPSISADGRFVAFVSLASDLVPGQGVGDVFLYDRTTKKIEQIDFSRDTSSLGSGEPVISPDGKIVAFTSYLDDLVPGDANQRSDVFVYNRETKIVERASVSDSGEEGNGYSEQVSLSDDGRFVAFSSSATNLTTDLTLGTSQIYVVDRLLKRIEKVSVNNAGIEGNSASANPKISGDGRFIAFESRSTNLTTTNNGLVGVFVFDREQRKIEQIDLRSTGDKGTGNSSSPTLSQDGRFVVFDSSTDDLVNGDNNKVSDSFIFDRTSRTLERISTRADGTAGNGTSNNPKLSSNGQFVAFRSDATNLITNDTNHRTDLFVVDRGKKSIESVTYREPRSILEVSFSTIAYTSDGANNASVAGEVRVSDTLFVSNSVEKDLNTRISSESVRNILSVDPKADLVTPLQRVGNLPPVHFPVAGNPAIDPVNIGSSPVRDQVGQLRAKPDAGAVEAVSAMISGKLFIDRNRNGRLDATEIGVADVPVSVTGLTSRSVRSTMDDRSTSNINENGELRAEGLIPGSYQIEPKPAKGLSVYVPPLETIRRGAILGNGDSRNATITANGLYIVFVSSASNLVSDDTNDTDDIFVYDRAAKEIERIPGQDAFSQAPIINADGRFVVFESARDNLVPGDTNQSSDVFVFDRTTRTYERIGLSDIVVEGSGASVDPSISSDGRYISFVSTRDGLVSNDTNRAPEVFVFDRTTKRIERILASQGLLENSNASCFDPSLSRDGRFIVFESFATGLVTNDTNNFPDIYVYDQISKSLELVSAGITGVAGNGHSRLPIISGNGRFVAYVSDASDLVIGDDTVESDYFVFDRQTKMTSRIEVNGGGVLGVFLNLRSSSFSEDGRYFTFSTRKNALVPDDLNGSDDVFVFDTTTKRLEQIKSDHLEGFSHTNFGESPSISADGRFIAFESSFNVLVPGDINNVNDVFIAANPLAPPGVALSLQAGEIYSGLNIGLIPDRGALSGRAFEDTILNGSFDQGEPVFNDLTVFLDANANRLLDADEVSTKTTADGSYRFDGIDTFQNYSIAIQSPPGFSQIAPTSDEQFAINVFLPAGGSIADRDFGFVRSLIVGQSQESVVEGTVFNDSNSNGVFDEGTETVVPGVTVFIDNNGDRQRQHDEVRAETDANGKYTISMLGAQIASVVALVDGNTKLTSPKGSSFTKSEQSLFPQTEPFANPQAIITAPFDSDAFPDIAVALIEANRVSIRINDGQGGFAPSTIEISVPGNGPGPIALNAGLFNSNTLMDMAVVNNLNETVTIMLDFNGTDFESKTSIAVGTEPIDIASGRFNHDSFIDLAVVNKGTHNVSILLNNGDGTFRVASTIETGGILPSAILAGQFNDDNGDGIITGSDRADIVVVNSRSSIAVTNGNVTFLKGFGDGSFVSNGQYPVASSPLDLASADFDLDGNNDLAVANFSSNTISILNGSLDGLFQVRPETLGVPAGTIDLAVADIENDGDFDIVSSNLRNNEVSIFRNTKKQFPKAQLRFEPADNIGVLQISFGKRMPLALADVDKSGTVDIVLVPNATKTVNVLKNTLVNGAHRVSLTGSETVSGLNFGIATPNSGGNNSDFGDAPTSSESGFAGSYPTKLSDNGARHVSTNLFLGGKVDIETDGNPDSSATGDDVNVNDDEDGIRFTTSVFVNSTFATTSMFTATASLPGRLDAWIDFNRDGDWSDSGEQIVNRLSLLAGVNRIPFTVPSGVSTGTTYARFRLSSVGGLSFDGAAADGEVEDYQLSLVGGTSPSTLTLFNQDLGQHRITIQNGLVQVQMGATTVFSAPETAVNRIEYRSETDAIVYSLVDPSSYGFDEIQTDTTGLPIGVRLVASTASLSRIATSFLSGLYRVDLTNPGSQQLQFTTADIATAARSQSLRIVLGAQDTLTQSVGWEFEQAFLESDQVVQRFNQGAAKLEIQNATQRQNPLNVFDVSGDGVVSPVDVLQIINHLKRRGTGNSSTFPQFDPNTPNVFGFFDVDGSNSIEPIDVLRVINAINRRSSSPGNAEGETDAIPTSNASIPSVWGYIGQNAARSLLTDREEKQPRYKLATEPQQVGISSIATAVEPSSKMTMDLKSDFVDQAMKEISEVFGVLDEHETLDCLKI